LTGSAPFLGIRAYTTELADIVQVVDVHTLADEFALRQKSYLWKSTDPDPLARWVLSDTEPWAGLELITGARETLGLLNKAFAVSGESASVLRALALGVVGGFARIALPLPAVTAGRTWIITAPAYRLVRLTVGLPEVAIARWHEREGWVDLTLRIARSPIDEALDSKELDSTDLDEWGIERVQVEEDWKTQAGDAAWFACPGLDAAEYFLSRPAVRVASRLMCARLVLDGRAPHGQNYNPELTATAWAAAEHAFPNEDLSP
jgi:hypothetical protein